MRSPALVEQAYKQFLANAKLAEVLLIALLVGFAAQAATRWPETSTVVVYAILSVAALRAARVSSRFKDVAYGLLTMKQTLLVGVVVGCSFPLAALFISIVERALFPTLAGSISLPGVSSTVALPHSLWHLILPLVLAPLAETAIFQVWIQSQVSRYPWVSFCIGSLCFIAVHLELNPMIVFASLGLSAVRAFTRSSGCVLIAHIAANSVVFGFLLIANH